MDTLVLYSRNYMAQTPLGELGRVHCIGMGGIGVSALARLMHSYGVIVSGCDNASSEICVQLAAEGVSILSGHDVYHCKSQADLVIATSAIPDDHPELVAFAHASVPIMRYPEALGVISRTRPTIAIAGTHGKSTTTAMVGIVFEAAQKDPLVIVGSLVPQFSRGNFRPGAGPFIVEACEYQRHFLSISPQVLVLTNIEADHLDYYRDVADVRDAFQTLVDCLPPDGILVINADDPEIGKLRLPKCRVITYGNSSTALIKLNDVPNLSVPGTFNRYNAAAAMAVARAFYIPDETINKVLGSYHGIWRRFEVLGMWRDATIISDYAHHPTAVAATISAARETFPRQRVVVVFQPHQHNRTKNLLHEFARSLIAADVIILPEIYDVAGREEVDLDISSRDIAVAIQQLPDFGRDKIKTVRFVPTFDELERTLHELVRPHDVVLVMGAGDIDSWARKFFSHA